MNKSVWRNKVISIVLLAASAVLAACDDLPTSDQQQQQQQQQERLSVESNNETGMPGIVNFTEKKVMKRLYEMRDKNIATYTYIADMNGRLHHVCDSMGYGLPYGVQYSNPEKLVFPNSPALMPQSEPNGLFMPPTAEGTWVICASTTGQFTPMYLEPRVIVSPFRLNAVDDYALPGNTNDALTKTELHSKYVPAIK